MRGSFFRVPHEGFAFFGVPAYPSFARMTCFRLGGSKESSTHFSLTTDASIDIRPN
jgi:hypothetical protein